MNKIKSTEKHLIKHLISFSSFSFFFFFYPFTAFHTNQPSPHTKDTHSEYTATSVVVFHKALEKVQTSCGADKKGFSVTTRKKGTNSTWSLRVKQGHRVLFCLSLGYVCYLRVHVVLRSVRKFRDVSPEPSSQVAVVLRKRL